MTVAIATSEQFAELAADDARLQCALRQEGIRAEPVVWDDIRVTWRAFEAVVIRSTWDYHAKASQFHAWVEQVCRESILINAASLVLWNIHKSYMLDLCARGIDIVPTILLPRGATVEMGDLFERLRTRELVIKPGMSASAHGLLVFAAGFAGAYATNLHLQRLLSEGGALVQPFRREVFHCGERSLIYFGGGFSHAVWRPPLSHGAAGGERRERLIEVSSRERSAAESVLRALDETPVYARVDLLPLRTGTICVMELELIEPALYFGLSQGSAGLLAREIVECIRHKKVL